LRVFLVSSECQSGEMKYLGTLMKAMKKNSFWIISITLVLVGILFSRDWDSRYSNPINGDAKAYYAYLPAIFIYQDPTFTFINEVENTYYPRDGSQFKDFMNEQKNGRSVNKTFPGLSILYAPFFFVAMGIAWIGGFPVDGYSMPFQLAIAFSHVAYFFIGLRFLLGFLRSFRVKDGISYMLFTAVIFGTNSWYYIIYDHSVGHIHNFFLSSVLIWTMSEWVRTRNSKALGWMGVTLALLVITRPTNAVMLLFLPLITSIRSSEHRFSPDQLKPLFSKMAWNIKQLLPYLAIGLIVLSVPFLLWKWQTDMWLVYSYKDEGFDFKHPYTLEFLFSYQKGWLLWSPVLIFGLVYSIAHWLKRSVLDLLLFILPIGLIIYVLSSWWCWTYGDGFGQRPMIEYIPFILIGTAFFVDGLRSYRMGYLIVLPLSFLSLIQGYQVRNSILSGGSTTKADYWTHFLQLRRDPPSVKIDLSWELVDSYSFDKMGYIDKQHPYSSAVNSDTLRGVNHLLARVKISGKEKDQNLRLILSGSDGKVYQAFFLADFIFPETQQMEFYFQVPDEEKRAYSLYVWNGHTDSKASIDFMELKCYR
jgi:hypothetical protein